MKFITSILFLLLLCSCATSARNLTKLRIGMTKNQVVNQIGEPESVSSAFKTPDGKSVEVWDFRLSQYQMATTLSPYFDIYSLVFVNEDLQSWSKSEKGARLSEKGALKLLGYPDTTMNVYER